MVAPGALGEVKADCHHRARCTHNARHALAHASSCEQALTLLLGLEVVVDGTYPESVPVRCPTVLLGFAGTAFAIEPSADGPYHAGDAVRVKTLVFVKIRAYAISHYMRALPATKSKRAVIEIDTDKRLTFRMLRDVGADKIKNFSLLRNAIRGRTRRVRRRR